MSVRSDTFWQIVRIFFFLSQTYFILDCGSIAVNTSHNKIALQSIKSVCVWQIVVCAVFLWRTIKFRWLAHSIIASDTKYVCVWWIWKRVDCERANNNFWMGNFLWATKNGYYSLKTKLDDYHKTVEFQKSNRFVARQSLWVQKRQIHQI